MGKTHINKAVLQFKAELLRGEHAAEQRMVKVYSTVWRTLKASFDTFLTEATDNGGMDITRRPRFLKLMADTEAELNRFIRYADTAITSRQKATVELAQAHTADLATKAAGKGIRGATWQHLPTSMLEDLVGATADGSPLIDSLKKLVPDGVDAVRDVLTTGIAVAKPPTMIAREIRDELGGNLSRAITIARTEDMRAYRSSSLRAMQANPHIVDGWIWHASLSFSSCGACLAMHGSRHPVTEQFGSHPNCRCIPIPDAGDVEVETGESWFARQPEDIQRSTLSPAKYALYKAGKIDLKDLIETKHSNEWGITRYEKPLSRIHT